MQENRKGHGIFYIICRYLNLPKIEEDFITNITFTSCVTLTVRTEDEKNICYFH